MRVLPRRHRASHPTSAGGPHRAGRAGAGGGRGQSASPIRPASAAARPERGEPLITDARQAPARKATRKIRPGAGRPQLWRALRAFVFAQSSKKAYRRAAPRRKACVPSAVTTGAAGAEHGSWASGGRAGRPGERGVGLRLGAACGECRETSTGGHKGQPGTLSR